MADKSRQNTWKQVLPNQDSSVPSPRWGHASLVIGKQFVIYGGYADTIYKNDIWSYDSELKQWKEIKTWGKIPENRSNCSMNYDEKSNKLIVFGGGGSNKRKFNSIYALDWKTKQWTEVLPKGDLIPEERTYHSSEFIYPYLVVFGGQALTDLDDIWTFNFETLEWIQIEIDTTSSKPSGRRFHSSILMKDQMVIVGGCFARYRSLNDVWSINLSSLRQGNLSNLKWKQHKLDGSAYLTRWGHSSSLFKDKIYVFGGRFSSDLNDLLVIDLEANTIKVVGKAVVNAPSPRRRHSSAFLGSSLLVFGGFNGQYYNDLYFLTFNEELPSVAKSNIIEKFTSEIYNPQFIATQIHVKSNQILSINKDILYSNVLYRQPSKQKTLISYLESLTLEEAKLYLKYVYSGGTIPYHSIESGQKHNITNIKTEYKKYAESVQINLRWEKLKQCLEIPQANRNFGLYKISNQQWSTIVENSQGDVIFKFLNNSEIRAKKVLISLNSTYFKNMLSEDFNNEKHPVINIKNWNQKVFQVFVKFLQYDILFVPGFFEQDDWIELILLGQFYNVKRLVQICEYELIFDINSQNLHDLLRFAIENKLKYLQSHCAQALVRHQCTFFASDGVFLRYDHYQPSLQTTKIEERITSLKKQKHQSLYFDIQQNISDQVVLLPRGLQQKTSLQKLGSKRQSLFAGKQNAPVQRITRQL